MQVGMAPLLLADPSRSGARVPRYAMQSGEMPQASAAATPEQAMVLWRGSVEGMPKLRVPEGEAGRVMDLADRMQMWGGGPVIFERFEVNQMPEVTPNTLVKLDGGARGAPRQRIITAVQYAQEKGYKRPIVATVDPTRRLETDEQAVVADFALGAQDERELYIKSAIAEGFVLDSNDYGVRYLHGGSTYATMTHPASGLRMIILAPSKKQSSKNGVFNGYQTLDGYGAELPGLEDFTLESTDMVTVTGTHYGAMSAVNNLLAGHEMRINLASYHVVGDNQDTRGPQAHLIEMGLVLDALDRKLPGYPALRAALFS